MLRNNKGRQLLYNDLLSYQQDNSDAGPIINKCINELQENFDLGFNMDDDCLSKNLHQELTSYLLKQPQSDSGIKILKLLTSKDYFDEKIIKDNLYPILQKSIINNDISSFNFAISIYPYNAEDLNKFNYTGNLVINGAKLIHLAILQGKGNLDAFKELMNLNVDLNVKDFYGNNCLHYAARLGNKELYDYISKLNPQWEKEKNIFGYLPSEFSRAQTPIFVDQFKLINSFTSYMNLLHGNKLSKEMEEEVKMIKGGICFADSFLMGLHILRGKIARDEFFKFREMMVKFDDIKREITVKYENIKRELLKEMPQESHEELHKKIDQELLTELLKELHKPFNDPLLEEKGYKSLSDVFRYFASLYLYFFKMQKSSVVDFSKSDRSQQLHLVNNGKDGVNLISDYSNNRINENELLELINHHAANSENIIIDLYLTEDYMNPFLLGHNLSIVIKNPNEIYLCEPNAPFAPSSLSLNDIKTLMPLLYSYFNNIQGVFIYQYEANWAYQHKANLSSLSNHHAALFGNKDQDKIQALNLACAMDSISTFKKLLSPIANDQDTLDKAAIDKLVTTAVSRNSYRCLEFLLDTFKDKIDLKDIAPDDKKRVDNYFRNK